METKASHPLAGFGLEVASFYRITPWVVWIAVALAGTKGNHSSKAPAPNHRASAPGWGEKK